MHGKIESVKELREKYSAIKNTNKVLRSRLSRTDKLAYLVTERIGTMGFFAILFSWAFLWILWNMFAPGYLKFDPYPAFVLLLFITNIIEILLMPLIMIGQNIQGRHAELRAEHEYETSTKAEREIEIILMHLENQQELIEKQRKLIEQVLDRLEKKAK